MNKNLYNHTYIHTHINHTGSDKLAFLQNEKLEMIYVNMSQLSQLSEKLGELDQKVNLQLNLGEKLNQRLDYIDRCLSRPKAYIPSSIHSADYIHTVIQFYGERICCLTGYKDLGNPEEQGYSKGKTKAKKTDAEKLEHTKFVNAAHLIRTSEVQAYINVNVCNLQKEKLSPKSPRAAILLTKKFEVLLDLYLWTLIPVDPMSSAPHFLVCVLVKKDAA
jgi:hypothetical protein